MHVESVLLYVLGVLVIVVGLAVSIGLHEIGHLLPAKLFGVRVTQYMIGFGPTIFSRKRGETEYGVKAVPLGGYIAMSGMYPPKRPGGAPREASTGFLQALSGDDRAERRPGGIASMIEEAREASAETIVRGEEHRTFYQLPVWKRIVIMVGGPAMNLVLGFLFTAIVLTGFGVAQPGLTVSSVSECVVPAGSAQTECAAGDPIAPGAEAGVLPGDEIVGIDGQDAANWDQVSGIIRDAPGRTFTLEVLRDGEPVSLQVTPLLTERAVYDDDGRPVLDDAGDPVTAEVGFVGVSPQYETVHQSITEVPAAVGDNIGRVVHLILNLPQRLVDVAQAAFGGGERDPNGPMSVVGVGRFAGEIASYDALPVADRISAMLGILGSLNVMLFVFNLVPLMPLDGGHVAGAVWEAVRRFFAKLFGRSDPGPVDTAKVIPLTFVVVILLGGMSALLIYADIVNPISLF
ncbi:peptidase [Arenivirga flava]|uniref:Peptidase n=1 Tax=Arenivirga flava TaxID=1930060 RepID=A0AA37UGS7_9MICO|nr:peptidase [Arenivirga flava]